MSIILPCIDKWIFFFPCYVHDSRPLNWLFDDRLPACLPSPNEVNCRSCLVIWSFVLCFSLPWMVCLCLLQTTDGYKHTQRLPACFWQMGWIIGLFLIFTSRLCCIVKLCFLLRQRRLPYKSQTLKMACLLPADETSDRFPSFLLFVFCCIIVGNHELFFLSLYLEDRRLIPLRFSPLALRHHIRAAHKLSRPDIPVASWDTLYSTVFSF